MVSHRSAQPGERNTSSCILATSIPMNGFISSMRPLLSAACPALQFEIFFSHNRSG